MDVFTFLFFNWIPVIFPVIIVVFGALRLTWDINHRFVVNTRTREDVRRRLLRGFTTNAGTLFGLGFGMVATATIFAFWVVPTWHLVVFQPDSLTDLTKSQVHQHSLDSNTFSFLWGHGAWVFGIVYGSYVGLFAALWASLAFVLVLVVPNRYVALGVPFVVMFLANFVLAVAQVPQFSPIVATFPFNITAPPLWTAFVPLAFVAASVLAVGSYCWRNARSLECLT